MIIKPSKHIPLAFVMVICIVVLLPNIICFASANNCMLTVRIENAAEITGCENIMIDLYQIAKFENNYYTNESLNKEFTGIALQTIRTAKDVDKAIRAINKIIEEKGVKPYQRAASNKKGLVSFGGLCCGVYYGILETGPEGFSMTPFIVNVQNYNSETTVTPKYEYEEQMPSASPPPATTHPGEKTPAPVQTPSPKETTRPQYTVIVHYWKDGKEFKKHISTHLYGDQYRIVSPDIPGYMVDIAIIKGTITKDVEFHVHYVPQRVKLTVYYIYEDGTTAEETYRQTLSVGEEYWRESPHIAGYTPTLNLVSGTMPGRNLEYTVIYMTSDIIKSMEDYEVPLGLHGINMNVGICVD